MDIWEIKEDFLSGILSDYGIQKLRDAGYKVEIIKRNLDIAPN